MKLPIPVGFAFLLLSWITIALAGSRLQPVFRAAEAYKGLNSYQKKCGVDDYYSAVYESSCGDKSCFCAGPQLISDSVDECLLYYSNYLGAKPEVYSTENYNGIMMFFGNECGTFQVQTKSVVTQSITYSSTLVQTKTQPGSSSATGASNSGTGIPAQPSFRIPGTLITSGTNSGTNPGTPSDQGQQSQGGGGPSVGAWIGIAASILGCIAALVSIWYKCGRGRRDRS